MTDIDEMRSSIQNKDDLADFVEKLKDDFLKNQDDWENITLDQFLDAMSSWIRAMDYYYKNNNIDANTVSKWQNFADILFASRIYE